MLCGVSAAAAPANVPSADVGTVTKQFEQKTLAPAAPLIINETVEESSQAPAGSEDLTLTLQQVNITGSTVYGAEELRPLYAELLGKTIPLTKLFALAQSITDQYRKDGYLLSRVVVPAQSIEGGKVRLHVVEGYIADLDWQGADALPKAKLEQMAQQILQSKPLNRVVLERQILLINDLAGLQAELVMRSLPKATADEGAVGATIIVGKQGISGSVTADNYGSRYLGAFQAGVNVSIPHLLMDYSRTDLSLHTADFGDELVYGSARYTVPLNDFGTEIYAQAAYSHAEPGATLETSKIRSNSQNYTLGATHPWVRSRGFNVSSELEFNWKNIKSDILSASLYEDEIRVVRAGLNTNYSAADRSYSYGRAVVSRGLDAFGARKTGSLNLSRAQGHSDFTKWEASAGHMRPLTNSISMSLSASGQYSPVALLASEEFGFGGRQFGRAYDYYEISGDSGIAAAAELRYNSLPEWNSTNFQPFIFYDFGKVWNEDALSSDVSASSAGVGIRAQHDSGLAIELNIAQPLNRAVAAPNYGNGKNPRVHFNVSQAF